MKKITVNDRTTYQITSREITEEGFLRVPGRVARTGIQEYLAYELGLDGDPMRVIRVMRPEDQVFSDASLSSYMGTDVCVEHPSELVNADTYKSVTAGTVVSPGRRDGDYVVTDLLIKDKSAISAVDQGKVQLSAGYTAVYQEASDAVDWDYEQTDIKINHVALVDRARAGAQAKLFDNQPKGATMPVEVTLDSNRVVKIEDEATAALVADSIARLDKTATDAQAEAQKQAARADSLQVSLDEAKQAGSDEAVAARVQVVADTLAAARLIAGDEFTCDSVDPVEIKRSALVAAKSTLSLDGKDAAYVEAAFDMAPKKTEHHQQFSKDAATVVNGQSVIDAEPKMTAADKHKQSMANAWKGAQ